MLKQRTRYLGEFKKELLCLKKQVAEDEMYIEVINAMKIKKLLK